MERVNEVDRVNEVLTASLSEFKARPLDLVKEAGDEPFVILNHNKPAFYVIKPQVFEALLEALRDADLTIELLVEKRIVI